jgi:hypothetical protein
MSLILDGTSGLFGNVTGGDISGNFIGLNGNGSSLTATSTGSTTARSLANRFADVVNVKDFGAVGDGVTDDATAIQNALNAASFKKSGLFFPSGTYIIKKYLEVGSDIYIFGNGRQSVIKSGTNQIYTSGYPPYNFASQTIFVLYSVSNIEIESLTFDSSTMTPTFPNPGPGGQSWFGARDLMCMGSNNFNIKNCYFKSAGASIASVDCHNFNIENNEISCESIDNLPHHDGIIDQWWGSHDFKIINNKINGNTTVGQYAILFTATTSKQIGSNITFPAPIYNAFILNNYVENCKSGIWSMGRNGGCSNILICENIIENINENGGIYVSNTNNCVVSSNQTLNTKKQGINIFTERNEVNATGSISGTTLTITSIIYGTIKTGYYVTAENGSVLLSTNIVSQISGITGGVGTYLLNNSQSIASTTLFIGSFASQQYSGDNIIISNNNIKNAAYNNISTNDFEKTAIGITNIFNDANICVVANTIFGNEHSWCLTGSEWIQHCAGSYEIGTKAPAFTNFSNTIITTGANEIKWAYGGNTGIVNKIYSLVTSALLRVDLIFQNGSTIFKFFQNNNESFRIASVADQATGIQIYPHTDGNPPIISAIGTATNIDLNLQPKGSGKIRFGTHATTSDVPITGYIEIKDTSGNIRKLAVIA